MARLPEWAERVVAGRVSSAVRSAILGMGEAARPTLGRIATSPAYRDASGDGRRPGPAEAIDLLARMPYDDVTAGHLVGSLLTAPRDAEAPRIAAVLRDFGVRAVPHLVAGLQSAARPMAAEWMCSLLAHAGRRDGGLAADERILPALVAALRRYPGEAATALGRLGDPHAVLPLRGVLAGSRVGADASGVGDLELAMVGDAIERLGGELTPAERRKCEAADRRGRRRVGQALAAAFEESLGSPAALRTPGVRPRPEDPCPCRSGKPFQGCHDGDEAFLRELEAAAHRPDDERT